MDAGSLRTVAAHLVRGRSVVAFTGAGVSAESGLDTFREPGGLWERFDPEDVGTTEGFLDLVARRPWLAADFLTSLRDGLAGASPNAGHTALASLERDGVLSGIVTQNVDGLHQEAGSRNVVELHGNLLRRRCTMCDRTVLLTRAELVSQLEHVARKLRSCLVSQASHVFERCECGGLLRPDVVLFGEPAQAWNAAQRLMKAADVVLIVGASGAVYPAAELPESAKENGATIVEVNPNPTDFSKIADHRIEGPAADVLPALVTAVRTAGAPASQAG